MISFDIFDKIIFLFPVSNTKINGLNNEDKNTLLPNHKPEQKSKEKYEKEFRENMRKEFQRNASPRRSKTGTINKVVKPTSEPPKQAKG